MKKTQLRDVLLLSVPGLLLLSFGLWKPAKPTLTLKSVRIKPGINLISGKVMKGTVGVEVSTNYRDPSWFVHCITTPGHWSMRAEEPGIWLNGLSGIYVEDVHGIRYGKKLVAGDTKIYRPFVSRYGTYGIVTTGVKGDAYAITFRIPLHQIPASAGRLTLKAVLESATVDSLMQLPIAIVVRPK